MSISYRHTPQKPVGFAAYTHEGLVHTQNLPAAAPAKPLNKPCESSAMLLLVV
jgi:hypothetical protein